MFRPAISLLMATVFAALTCLPANAQSPAFAVAPRALCITDPYGTPYCHWYGSPVAFNSYFNYSPTGTNSFGYSFTNSGYYWSGVPAVASATTPEWTVQRTSVVPINAFATWGPTAPYSSPWQMRIGQNPVALPHTESPIQQTSATSPPLRTSTASCLEMGDRLFIRSRYQEAYLQYLMAERLADDVQELTYREAFALVLMQRHSHAVAKLKRGSATKSESIDIASEMERAFGVAYRSKLLDASESAEKWLAFDRNDPDRRFLAEFFKSLNTRDLHHIF